MAVRYLSEEWAQQALALVEADPRVAEATKGLRMSVLSIILHPPPDTYGFIYVAFDGDGLSEYRVGHDYHVVTEGIGDPTFVVSGDYEVFAQVQRGLLTERRAIMSGRLHLTGSFLKALRHRGALETLGAVLRDVECQA